ncbi:hypothetical protein AHAS_Ahas19G0121000 [Arachis hypogaea]
MEFISNPSDVLTENGISNSMDVLAAVANLKSDNNSQCSDVVEDSVTSLKCKTPTRRALNGVKHAVSLNIDNEEDFQLSTNKLSQKGGKKR